MSIYYVIKCNNNTMENTIEYSWIMDVYIYNIKILLLSFFKNI